MIRNRRQATIALATLTAAAALSPLATGGAAFAVEPANPEAEGLAALKGFWTAIVAGTPQALEAVLAPEYQIQRADGSGFDRAAYLKSELPKVAAVPEFTGLAVTGAGDLLVVRYEVTIESTRRGKPVQRHAPRLTVFRRQGDAWLVVAHANFATLAK
jgi:hypothetical protein